MGSRRVWDHSGEIAFTCAPAADSPLTSGGSIRGSGRDLTVPIQVFFVCLFCLFVCFVL